MLEVILRLELIEEVVREIEASRSDRPVSIRLTGSFGVVEASPEQLAHVFRNLVMNAVNHNEEKKDLLIEIGQYERGDEICFFVRDNGTGVPYEVQSRIFEPFYRGPTRRDDSLGLGLALVQAIVSQAGGKLGGASWQGLLAGLGLGALGFVIGLFAGGVGAVPFGILGALLGIFLVEYFRRRDWEEVARAGAGWLVGCLLSGVVQLFISLAMILIFVWQVLRG